MRASVCVCVCVCVWVWVWVCVGVFVGVLWACVTYLPTDGTLCFFCAPPPPPLPSHLVHPHPPTHSLAHTRASTSSRRPREGRSPRRARGATRTFHTETLLSRGSSERTLAETLVRGEKKNSDLVFFSFFSRLCNISPFFFCLLCFSPSIPAPLFEFVWPTSARTKLL
jgi:hypothetical protein